MDRFECSVETESLEVTRSLSAARKQYAASSRETAKHVVAANLVCLVVCILHVTSLRPAAL